MSSEFEGPIETLRPEASEPEEGRLPTKVEDAPQPLGFMGSAANETKPPTGPHEWNPTVNDVPVGDVQVTFKNDADEMVEGVRQKAKEIVREFEDRSRAEAAASKSGDKYFKRLITNADGKVDVYAVLEGFGVTCPARQHAIKKMLCAGQRGAKDTVRDLREAVVALNRAIELQSSKE